MMKKFMTEMRKKLLSREVITYFIAGVLTTVVDYLVFFLVNEALKRGGMDVTRSSSIATAAGWFFAVLFAYLSNKFYVFQSRDKSPGGVLREMVSFFAARAVSGLIVMAMMWILVDRGRMNEYIAKVLTSLFNLVFNYVASKLFIFRNQKPEKTQ